MRRYDLAVEEVILGKFCFFLLSLSTEEEERGRNMTRQLEPTTLSPLAPSPHSTLIFYILIAKFFLEIAFLPLDHTPSQKAR